MKARRIVVVLLILCLLLSLAPFDSAQAANFGVKQTAGGKTAASDQPITRAAWISDLADACALTVEEDSAPDNYYSDLTGDEAYFQDVLAATNVGALDIRAGMPFEPEKPATRAFAARSLNACLGLRLDEGVSYTFSEAEAVDHPDDLQIAIERGWFALQDGKFLPDQAITAAESEAMLADAKAILADLQVDENYNSIYQYKVGVVEIPEGTMVASDENDVLRIENCPVSLKAGDLFVAYFGGIPCAYSAKEVTKQGTETIVRATPIAEGDVLEDIDAQGSVEAEFTQFVPYEGTEVKYINEITKQTYTDPIEAEKSVQDAAALSVSDSIKLKRTLSVKKKLKLTNAISATVEFTTSDPVLTYKFNLRKQTAEVYLTGRYNASIGVEADLAEATDMDEIQLALVGVKGVGGLELSLVFELTGSGKAVYSGGFTLGMSYSRASGFCDMNNVTQNSFSLEFEAGFKAGFQVSLGVNDIPDDLIEGYCYFEVGPTGKIKLVKYPDDQLPKQCVHSAYFVYMETGIRAAFKFGRLESEYTCKKDIWTEKNSPIRVVHHYEDGVEVPSCTRENPEFDHFFTNSDSRWGGGWSGRNGAYGLNANGEPVQIYTYNLDEDGNAIITGYHGNASALIIPKTLDGHTVIAIGENAFKGLSGIRSVVMPDTIERVEGGAFADCPNLSSIVFSENTKLIGYESFARCNSLVSVDLPKKLERIGSWTFRDCVNLVSVFYPKSLTEGGSVSYEVGIFNDVVHGIFDGCYNLKQIRFEEGMTRINGGIFAGCGIEHLVIPEGITSIGDNTFAYCPQLKSISFPESLVKIGSNTFKNCPQLEEVVLPDYLAECGQAVFANCTALRSVYIPKSLSEGVAGFTYNPSFGSAGGMFGGCSALREVRFEPGTKNIHSGMFAGSGLRSLTVPDTITAIGDYTFACSALEEIHFPDTLLTIGANAFWLCNELKELDLPKYLNDVHENAFASCSSLERVFIPRSLSEGNMIFQLHSDTDPTGIFNACGQLRTVEFEEGTTAVHAGMFAACGIEEITIPKTVKTIGRFAFGNCPNLESVTLPEGLEEVKQGAFQQCPNLKAFVFPESVTTIGMNVLSQCTKLESAKLPKNYPEIPSGLFNRCESLTDFTIPDTVKIINGWAFSGCAKLPSVKIPEGCTKIETKAFDSCKSLSEIRLPDSVVEIGEQAFNNCDGIKTMTLPDGVKTVSFELFYDCDDLKSVTLPNSVVTISKRAFESCDSLTEVRMGTGLTEVGENAFAKCTALETVTLPFGVKTIQSGAFTECPKLQSVTILRNASTIADKIFSYPDKVTIYGVVGTRAESYAAEVGAKFVAIDHPVQSFSLSQSSIVMRLNEKPKLTVLADPVDFTDEYTWKSTNTDVVNVIDGVLYGVHPGEADVRFVVGNRAATCHVTVMQPVTRISLSPSAVTLDIGSVCELTAHIVPDNATNKAVRWASSDESVASVTQDGVVTALKAGTATITCTAQDGSGVSGSCRVTVSGSYLVTDVKDLQSKHPYGINCSDIWIYQVPGASSLQVTFNGDTSVEQGSDYIYLYDSEGNEVGRYTGTELAGQTVTVPGYLVKIKLVSDGSYCEYGFAVTEVKAIASDHTHAITAVARVNATCTQDGTEPHWKCSICGMLFSDAQGRNVISAPAVIKATGHKWDAGTVTKEPTDTTEGVKTFTCTVCGETRTESIPKLTPQPTTEPTAQPTTQPTAEPTAQPTTPPVRFSDVPAGAYYAEPVSWAVNHTPQITNGTSPTTFSPDANCTRGQIVTFLWRAKGQPEPKQTNNPFADVNPNDYYYKAVLWAVEQGITNGMDATHFSPNTSCTRGQAVTFLWRAENKPAAKTQRSDFKDVQDASAYYYTPVLWAVENGITNGTSATTFSPNQTCTRGQIVTFLYRDLAK